MAELIDITVPSDQQEGTQSVVATWLKKPGQAVEANEPIVELSTDKAMVEIASPASGTLKEILVNIDEPALPGAVLGRIQEGALAEQLTAEHLTAEPSSTSSPANQIGSAKKESASIPKGLRASPAVKRLALKYGVSLQRVNGSGRAGRITKQDLLPHLPDGAFLAGSTSPPQPPKPVIPEIKAKSRSVPHDFMRRTIARRMSYSLIETAPHVTAVFDCDLTRVQEHRNATKEKLKRDGVNLSYTAYFVWACVQGIQASPEVNSRWHNDRLEIFEEMNIGIGTALEDRGLVVPVIKNAQTLSLEQIAAQLTQLTAKAREGKLSSEEMANGTFTISNHGVSGSLLAAPIIIQQPQSAILGIGKLEERPAVVEGKNGQKELAIRPKVYISLTIDHRVLDAYHTNRFLSAFVESLESLSVHV